MPSTPQTMGREIVEITQEVFATMLGVDIAPRDIDQHAAAGPLGITGMVRITGRWNGSVCVETTPDAARQMASLMFGMATDEATVEEMSDALGEMANMIGGNVKNQLDPPVSLSCPEVFEATDGSPLAAAEREIHSNHFDLSGQPPRITVFEYATAQEPEQGASS